MLGTWFYDNPYCTDSHILFVHLLKNALRKLLCIKVSAKYPQCKKKGEVKEGEVNLPLDGSWGPCHCGRVVRRGSPRHPQIQHSIPFLHQTQTETISISEPDLFLVVNSLFYLHFDTFVSQEPSEKNLLMEVCLSFSSIPPSNLQSSRSCRRPPPQRFGSKAQIFFYYNFYFLDLCHLVPKRTRVQSSEY